MNFLPFGLLIICSVCIGGMAECRKGFQVKNGIGLYTTLLFSCLNSAVATAICLFFVNGYSLEPARLVFSAFYAAVTVVISSLCLVGRAWGTMTVLIASASLGGLVFPSLFGLIFQPEDNQLTWCIGLGFVFAFVCLAFLFSNAKGEKNQSGEHRVKYVVSCILVFLLQGSALIVFKMINTLFGTTQHFNFMAEYMLLSTVLCGVLAVIIRGRKSHAENKVTLKGKSVWFAVGYAALFFTSEFLGLQCASMVPLTFQAPVSFCIPILVTAILERILYNTKIEKKEWFQLLFAATACICFVI